MKKTYTALILMLILATLLAACTRSASKAPEVTPGAVEGQNTPLPVDQQILNATMTAQAIMQEFNMPTQVIKNADGSEVVITQVPPTAVPTITPTSPATPTMPALVRPATWAVQSGEYIACLARRFDVNPDDIIALNPGVDPSALQIGQVLNIPQSGSWPTDSRALGVWSRPDTWTVTAGETVYGIACQYGDIWPEEIIAANGLTSPYDLSGITTLQIP